MEVMTIGVLCLALLMVKKLIIDVLVTAIVAAGSILLLVSVAYGVYDRIRSKKGGKR